MTAAGSRLSPPLPRASAALAAALAFATAPLCVRGVLVKMSDPGILFSPFNWQVTDVGAKTINPGAYFRTVFQGQSLSLHTDTSANTVGPFSQFWTRVDGGPLHAHTIAPGSPTYDVNLCDPTCTASDSHLLEVIVKSTSETIARWSPQTTSITFTGIEVTGFPLVLPRRKPYNVLVFGDSITEGVRTMGYVGIQNDTDRNDAVRDYSFQLSQSLPCEVGVVAFGATGVTKGGSGNVPALPVSWNQLWDGAKRDFATFPPDLVVYNEGTNDRPNITEGLLGVVKLVAQTAPKAKQLLLLPFDGSHRADIKAVVAAMASPGVVFGDTTGFYSGADGLHPFGYNHVGSIMPKMAALVAPLLVK